jgi:IPT/TIG domain-containing protein
MFRATAALLAAAAVASPAAAQVSQSANFQLLDYHVGGGGGFTASANGAAFVALTAPAAGGHAASANFQADVGFVASHDAKPSNAPVLFGVTPSLGMALGNDAVTISGLNFTKYGAGPTVTGAIDGNPLTNVVVVSDTTITAKTPAGTPGQKDVTVTSVHGTGTLPSGFAYSGSLVPYGTGTPGCLGTEVIGADSFPKLGNSNFHFTSTNTPPSQVCVCIVTDAPDYQGSDPFQVGALLHVDYFSSTEIYAFDFISNANNFALAHAPIPNFPPLIGKHFYAIGLWIETECTISATNISSTTGLAITIEAP